MKRSLVSCSFLLGVILIGCNSAQNIDTYTNIKASFKLGEWFWESHWGFTDMDMQPDGKSVVVGIQKDSSEKIIVARFLPNGQPDITFANDSDPKGVIWLDVYDDTPIKRAKERATGVTIEPDGDSDPSNNKIIVCGFYEEHNWFFGWDNLIQGFGLVARFLPNGELDKTFNGDGIADFSLGSDGVSALANDWTTVNDCVAQNDGTIIIAGHEIDNQGEAFIAKLNKNGDFDHTFATNGVYKLNLTEYGEAFIDC